MSDSVNIEVRDASGSVFLYGHWLGSTAPALLQKALQRHQRWRDAPYLARLIFSEMIGDGRFLWEERGLGIAAQAASADWPTIVVDTALQCVFLEPRDCPDIGFEAFCALAPASWQALDPKEAENAS